MPIVGQFGRDEVVPAASEQIPFELVWHDGVEERGRLASPLIVKPMPLADGSFAPIALWLLRVDPNGKVQLRGLPSTAARFGKLVGSGETAYFSPLRAGGELRDIFLDWVLQPGSAGLPKRVAP